MVPSSVISNSLIVDLQWLTYKLILLSGIFEGEGHFGNHKNGKYKSGKTRFIVEATIEMVDEDIISVAVFR